MVLRRSWSIRVFQKKGQKVSQEDVAYRLSEESAANAEWTMQVKLTRALDSTSITNRRHGLRGWIGEQGQQESLIKSAPKALFNYLGICVQ